MDTSHKMAVTLKQAYNCDGITIRQNNEPASEQHAFHYHMHIFPRYEADDFNKRLTEKSRLSDSAERLEYVEKINKYLS